MVFVDDKWVRVLPRPEHMRMVQGEILVDVLKDLGIALWPNLH